MRVLLGPSDPAGVASNLSEGLKQNGHDAQVVLWEPSPYGYRHDRTVGSLAQRLGFVAGAGRHLDVVHAFGGRSWVPYADLLVARMRGATCLMQYNGTDARSSEIARRLHPARARVVDPKRDRNTRVHRRVAGRVAHAAVVQDLELVTYLLSSYRTIYVLPFAIDIPALEQAAAKATPREPGSPLRVFHAPSSRAVKGSNVIEAALRTASEEVAIEPITLSGAPHSEVLAEIARADIVVDQLNAETPGVLAAEAMALGKPVLCEFQERKLATFARPCPVVPMSPGTVAERLTQLAKDQGRRRELGEAGRSYARRLHAPQVAARAAEAAYHHSRTGGPGIFEVAPGGVRELSGAEVRALSEALPLSE